MHALEAISPVDGRYRRHTEPLSAHLSEMALMRYRLRVEAAYLIALSDTPDVGMRLLTPLERHILTRMPDEFELKHAEIVKRIETKGWKDFKKTNHDVKAVELFMRDALGQSSMSDCLEWIHFALTSEDVNNLAYAMMLHGAVGILIPELQKIQDWMDHWATRYADLPMQARTHGQPASPTALGKEVRVFAERLRRQIEQLLNHRTLVKLNGATGNYNAHVAARPNVDWIAFTVSFIERLNEKFGYQFKPNLYTTQVEPHETYSELFAILHRINTLIIAFCQDMWRYISDDWIAQIIEGIGSSVMPQKVNPIDYENAEGNAEIANGLFDVYMRVLPRARLQRHLSDSTIIRSFGEALGHCQIVYRSLQNGLGKINPDPIQIGLDLGSRPEVLAEGYQTILRAEGFPNAYDRLKDATQGKKITLPGLHDFARSLEIDEATREKLLALTPRTYTGLASYLASGMELNP